MKAPREMNDLPLCMMISPITPEVKSRYEKGPFPPLGVVVALIPGRCGGNVATVCRLSTASALRGLIEREIACSECRFIEILRLSAPLQAKICVVDQGGLDDEDFDENLAQRDVEILDQVFEFDEDILLA